MFIDVKIGNGAVRKSPAYLMDRDGFTGAKALSPLYQFHNNEIRVVMIGGDPWFVAVDVCLALSIHLRSDGRPNTSAALTKVDSTEKQTLTGSKVHRMNLTTSNRGITLISESGLYKLVMRSDKPEARHFQDWVTRDVLPAIHAAAMRRVLARMADTSRAKRRCSPGR